MSIGDNFKEFQDSKKLMTTQEFNEKFDTDEATGEIGVITYGGTNFHININRDGFSLVIGNKEWSRKDLMELECIFWSEFAEIEFNILKANREKSAL